MKNQNNIEMKDVDQENIYDYATICFGPRIDDGVLIYWLIDGEEWPGSAPLPLKQDFWLPKLYKKLLQITQYPFQRQFSIHAVNSNDNLNFTVISIAGIGEVEAETPTHALFLAIEKINEELING
jgi:hypothetical protein